MRIRLKRSTRCEKKMESFGNVISGESIFSRSLFLTISVCLL